MILIPTIKPCKQNSIPLKFFRFFNMGFFTPPGFYINPTKKTIGLFRFSSKITSVFESNRIGVSVIIIFQLIKEMFKS